MLRFCEQLNYISTVHHKIYCKDEIGSLIVDVEIHWLDRDSMKIALVHKEDFGIGGHAQYEVSWFFFLVQYVRI